MERVLLDANILVSAAIRPQSGIAGLWDLEGVRLVASPYVLAEARRNVLTPDALARLESLIADLAVLPAEPADFPLPNDPGLPPKDRPVLLAAIAARTSILLTGDLSHFGSCMGRSIRGVTMMLPGDYLTARRCARG